MKPRLVVGVGFDATLGFLGEGPSHEPVCDDDDGHKRTRNRYLVVGTMNVTSGSSLIRVAESGGLDDLDDMCVQETKVWGSKAQDLKTSMCKLGWHCDIEEAESIGPTGKHVSCGVAIIWRKHISVVGASCSVVKHRAISLMFNSSSFGAVVGVVVCASVEKCVPGEAQWKDPMKSLAAHVENIGKLFVVGTAFNWDPEYVAEWAMLVLVVLLLNRRVALPAALAMKEGRNLISFCATMHSLGWRWMFGFTVPQGPGLIGRLG